MNRGKAFEYKFRRVLSTFDGICDRIEDGGAASMNRQYGDFYYFPPHPGAVLFECKACAAKSFELRRIGWGERNGQLERMLKWQDRNAMRYAYIVFEFYTDGEVRIVEVNRFRDLAREAERAGRKSINKDKLGAPYRTIRKALETVI